jgi:hypothetical protein
VEKAHTHLTPLIPQGKIHPTMKYDYREHIQGYQRIHIAQAAP